MTMKTKRNHATFQQITSVADKHKYKPFTPVDAAIIATLGHSYYNLLDLSKIRVSDLMKHNGNLVDVCCYGSGEKTKLLRVSGYVRDILEVVVQWRLNLGYGVTSCPEYNNLDPDSQFFLDAGGSPFGVGKVHNGNTVSYAPYGMRKRFKKYSLPAGWKVSTLNDSFLYGMWRSVSMMKPSDATKILEQATGLTPSTIKQKTYEEPIAVYEALARTY